MSEFVDYLHEVFEEFGLIRTRRMFGGHGVYHDDLMFGLIADDVLYLKADTELQEKFLERGLEQFQYVKNGKPIKMSYFMAPVEVYEDQSVAKAWAELSYGAAMRSKSKSSKKRRK